MQGENSIAAAPAATTAVEPRVAGRNHSIDSFRVVANLGIICVHTGPFMAATFDPDVRFYGELINQFARAAAPFFFLAAGYFFAVSLSRGATPLALAAKLIKRLMTFFLFWSAVYVLVPVDSLMQTPAIDYASAVRLGISHVLSFHFLLNGSKVHLWFLPALSCSLALLGCACRWKWERGLFLLSISLYVVGLLAGAYKASPIGWDLGFNTRNGPFFGTLFVASGFLMHRAGWQFTQRQGLYLIVVGLALRIMELWLLSTQYGTLPSGIDYLVGTYPFSIGIFVLLLTSKWLGEVKWMVKLSRYSAGVYCGHALAIELLKDRSPTWDDPLWEITRPFVALALTFILVMTMSKIRALRSVTT